MAERAVKPKNLYLNKAQRQEVLAACNGIVAAHGLRCSFLEGVRRGGVAMAVGVTGDARAYTPVINLKGPFPGYNELARLSTEISNTLPIIKVTYELAN